MAECPDGVDRISKNNRRDSEHLEGQVTRERDESGLGSKCKKH